MDRNIIINFNADPIKSYKDFEVYNIDTTKAIEDQIDSAILTDLHCPIKILWFVGKIGEKYVKVYGADYKSTLG